MLSPFGPLTKTLHHLSEFITNVYLLLVRDRSTSRICINSNCLQRFFSIDVFIEIIFIFFFRNKQKRRLQFFSKSSASQGTIKFTMQMKNMALGRFEVRIFNSLDFYVYPNFFTLVGVWKIHAASRLSFRFVFKNRRKRCELRWEKDSGGNSIVAWA